MDDKLLTPKEVARMFRVDPKTVARWAKRKEIEYIKTPGGQYRFCESKVRAILENPELV